MDDPFSALNKALELLFEIEQKRHGDFVFPEIRALKKAIETYHPEKKTTFKALVKALGGALPHFEKWGLDFDLIKNATNSLAKEHQMPAVNWDKFLSHPKVSPKFQFTFSNAQQEIELIPWLTDKARAAFTQHKSSVQVRMLIDYQEHLGFSQKLSTHLEKDPGFLSRLIMESENNFIKISNTRLILYLTDEQIAEAIIRHLPKLLQDHQNPLMQVEQLVDKLNGILSNGRSISTLLRNAEAKSVLDNSEFFQIYQSEAYKNRLEQSPSASEEEDFKPGF